MDSMIAWILRTVQFGTVIMFGAMGEIVTEKSGNLNLGVPGIMYLGGFAGFAAAYLYEMDNPAFIPLVGVILALAAAFLAAMLGGLIYSFLTTTLRANQNVTGLALSIFGKGVANFFGAYLLNGKTATQTTVYLAFQQKIPGLSSAFGVVSQFLFSYGFMVYGGVIIAIVLHYLLNHTRTGLNLRAVGEDPATADAAGVSVTKYKYAATCLGAGISGLGGLFYVLDYNNGIWATTDQIEALGWLAVALVIFTTWKPLNAIWGSFLFGLLYWLYSYLPALFGIKPASHQIDLIQMLPYIVTIIVLIITSLRKKHENLPPQSLGLAYFREER